MLRLEMRPIAVVLKEVIHHEEWFRKAVRGGQTVLKHFLRVVTVLKPW